MSLMKLRQSMKDDAKLLRHAIEAIELIEEFLGVMTFSEFENDNKTISAVVRQIEIIGEAMKHLSPVFQQKYPELRIADAVGMRNIIVHEYFDVDLKVVWDTCVEDIPKLKKAVSDILIVIEKDGV